MYGQCFDGHFHKIQPQYQRIACDDKSLFKSFMFDKEYFRGVDLSHSEFVPLPPLNCPNKSCFPSELENESPKSAELKFTFPKTTIKPYSGISDSRTPVEFLLSFEEDTDRKTEPRSVTKIKLLHLLQDALCLSLDEVETIQYEDLRQKFLLEFWSMDKQTEIRDEFERSSFPVQEGQTVVEYVERWLDKLNGCTIMSPERIIYDFMNRIPNRYALHVSRLVPKDEEFTMEIRLIVQRCQLNLNLILKK